MTQRGPQPYVAGAFKAGRDARKAKANMEVYADDAEVKDKLQELSEHVDRVLQRLPKDLAKSAFGERLADILANARQLEVEADDLIYKVRFGDKEDAAIAELQRWLESETT